ncbi:alpha/beta fold hydrolase [Azospirillum rugosum]|uniref:Pimeloyl-ACP methyl ester carboxylesterase n=1 Tax=Azospirillum rugosum TaxID=416170 RepID=A0ABS4SXD9_9PROT|nr:alpha/beta fold hydrolase [Azospirillum rugosum]MBP2297147.1 pimeloyl-ACP methyl ester carboxylesterase [Azospirillum rugosum]MDQ0530947.1 pimeloyl-ACP methyl ester carboxylesterase [Azospirillum rugosum]
MQEAYPDIARTIDANGIATNLHDVGSGAPVALIHGSGPGVTAWANWRGVIPALSRHRRVIAPDMVGFGFTERPHDVEYNLDLWIKHLTDILDALNLDVVDLVGNSFGGALSLAFTIRFPKRVRRLVLMGSAGVNFDLTEGLNAVWGYEPSVQNMRKVMDYFAYDRSLVNDELAELRYKASIRPGFQESFSAMFPVPRQRWVSALASNEDDIRAISQEALILHGRDDNVVPLETSLRLNHLIVASQLHVFGRCGHWVQIEQAARFIRLVEDFLAET